MGYRHLSCAAWAILLLAGCVRDTPAEETRPFVTNQEVVKINVAGRDRVEIESCSGPGDRAVIHYFAKERGPQPGRPMVVEWHIAGLREDHTLYITAKDGSPEELFDFPDKFRGKRALKVPGRFDAVTSGPPNGRVLAKLLEGRQVRKDENGHKFVSWFYDITVVDKKGEVVGRLDPEVMIYRYPPD